LKIMEDCADAEASIRSIRLKSHISSPYLFKMSLACPDNRCFENHHTLGCISNN
jgi:hypothetical protein